jgi:glycosyltransferase involved in cell wall biosynthesis
LEQAERGSCSFSTRTYTISPSLQQLVLQLGLCPTEKIATLGDGSCAGIDLELFNPEADHASAAAAVRDKYRVPAEAKLLTYLGRIANDKGIAILAGAWWMVARDYPDLFLLIAGEPDPTDPVFDYIIQSLRGHERVRFSDAWIREMPPVYAATTICVLPTFREGLSQVALEAGAMGVPVVGTRITGLVDSVLDGITGLLVPAGDIAAFAGAIRRLLDDEACRARMGSAGREHVASRFSDRRVDHLWLEEYRRLISKPQPKCLPSINGIANEY